MNMRRTLSSNSGILVKDRLFFILYSEVINNGQIIESDP